MTMTARFKPMTASLRADIMRDACGNLPNADFRPDYHGRNNVKGPAIVVDRDTTEGEVVLAIKEVIECTFPEAMHDWAIRSFIPLRHDSMGLGVVFY
jgi:hypothetical protein